MDPSSPSLDLAAFYAQAAGAGLFSLVFLFLYRQSRAMYFGLWAAAWLLRVPGVAFAYQHQRTASAMWLALYAAVEFAFAVMLIAAARCGFESDVKDWRKTLRLLVIVPFLVVLVWRFPNAASYPITHGLIRDAAYFYNFLTLRRSQGLGSRLFRYSLLILALTPLWARFVQFEPYLALLAHFLLAFGAMAMWTESQMDRVRELAAELDYTRRDTTNRLDRDRLTGLLNQAALARLVEKPESFRGVVAVCDMDNFKEINDRYGHLVGDEILRNIGHLLQGSIRHSDEAFRWGGDEFVILFYNQRAEVARNRMAEIEARLRDFQVRGHGVLPISFSWGTAEAYGRALRDALDEADRNMYAFKRKRAGGKEHLS